MSRLLSNRCCSPTIALLVLLGCGSSSRGQSPSADLRDTVTVGIEGHYRAGRWTAIRSAPPQSGPTTARVTVIETRDGDGVQVDYVQPNQIDELAFGYAIPGSEAAPLILHNENDVVVSTRFPTLGSPSRGPAMIPLTMPWIVVFGDPLGVDQIGANELLDRDAMIAVSMPQSASGVPDSMLGYDGVDMMLLGRSSADLLASLNEKQQQAIANWITDGGRVFLTMGGSAPELLRAAPWLIELLPLDELTTLSIDPSAIETYTSSQTPLESFTGVKLPRNKGRILISGRTTRRVVTPVAVEYNVGFGRITVVAADLDDDLFASWPERLDLITQLTGSILIPDQPQPQRKSRATAYNDLAGQLRTTLDRFAVKRNFGFSIVSLILMALIAAIGPLDYLLINRVLGRPLLGWVSFPLVAIGLSIILAQQARPASTRAGASATQAPADHSLKCNRIEIFDVDAIEEIGRGFTVSYLYAHDASRFDVQVAPSDLLSSITGEMQSMLTAPFGYPGESFGGIQIAIEDARLPIYQVPLRQSSPVMGRLEGLPLASRSSKGVATRCWFKPELAAEVSMGHRAGSELLQGELINPLPFDLLDGMLIYRNWTYVLPTRFPSGGRIARVDTLRQKNFRWQLSHQKALESSTETEAWDPAKNNSPQRIAEMLMFHGAVGGSRYTSLRDDPLSFLDLSQVLAEDRCILMGKVAETFTEIEAKNSDSVREPTGESLTLLRVVLPVKDSRR